MSALRVSLGGFVRPASRVKIRLFDDADGFEMRLIESNVFEDEEWAVSIDVNAEDQGYWGTRLLQWSDEQHVILEPIVQDGPHGWWHAFHQIDGDTVRGSGVRIGVIDDYLRPEAAQKLGVTVVPPTKFFSTEFPNDGRDGVTDHAEAVVSLIAAKDCGSHGFDGTAAGAEVFFACGRDWATDPHDYNENDDYAVELAPQVVANAIRCLSEDYGCQIITISAGRLKEVPEVHNEVRAAQALGTLVLAGAGNDAIPAYPAAYRECFSVSALGKYGTAPVGSVEESEEELAEPYGEPEYFHWLRSGTPHNYEPDDSGLEAPRMMAAGVNVVWSRNGRSAFACTGTSFASPISAGVCASILAGIDETGIPPEQLWNHRCSNLLGFCDIVRVRESAVAIPKARRNKVVMHGSS